MRFGTVTVGFLVWLSLFGGKVLAAPPASEAKVLFESGTKHYNLAEFGAALADFKEAYRLRPDPVFLFNIAQCHRRLDDPASATTFYQSYLREAPGAPNRAEVERILGELDRSMQAKAKAKADADAASARLAEEAARADRERATPPVAAPATDAALVAAPPPRKPLVKRAWFWGVIGGGVVVVAAAVTVGLVLGVVRDPSPSIGSAELH